MNYPLISEYVEAIKAAEDNFDQLKHLRPVLGEDGEPVMTSGNFAVVFKMKDEQTGKLHAVKCFLKEQEGRAEAYRQIAEELEYVSSTFLTPIKYLDKEFFVDSANSEDSEFPVLLMDWVEGQTLDKYIREHIDDQYELSLLAYQFSRLAMWLMPQPFAHGDLKPDNILVKEDGTLVLVDYDGMYVPAMKGQKARELGSPDFRHPSRTEEVFDDHIDDFSLASILLSLKAIALQPSLLEEYGASDRLLFSEKDYRNLSESSALGALQPLMQDPELASLYSLYILALSQNNLSQVSFRLFNLSRPDRSQYEEENLSTEVTEEDLANAWTDEYGVKYSADRKKLLSAKNCYNLKGIDYFVKEGTQVICDEALQFNAFRSIILPNSIISIGSLAFANSIFDYCYLPDSVKFISHNNPWGGCFDIKEFVCKSPHFVIKDGILYSSDYKVAYGLIFWEPNIEIDSRTREICANAFWSGRGVKIYINNVDLANVVKIGHHAFFSCKELVYIHIPDSVASIENGAFKSCESLTNIHIPDSVENIGSEAFSGCKTLTSINIPDNVTSIEDGTFKSCESLTNIHIPAGVTSIKEKAFAWCKSLTSIIIPEGVTNIYPMAFYGCESLTSIYIPENVSNIGCESFSACNALKTIVINENNQYYDSRNNCNAIIETKSDALILGCNSTIVPNNIKSIANSAFCWCKSITFIHIPKSVSSIGVGAFEGCEALASIHIPDSVTSIGEKAFRHCESLTSIHIPDSITSIEKYTFSWCGVLSSVNIPEGVTSIGINAFYGCKALSIIVVNKKNKFYDSRNNCNAIVETKSDTLIVGCKSTVIPNNIKIIGEDAFCGCESLTSIHIPESVTRIENGAFAYCESLVSIHIPKSVSSIGVQAFEGCKSLTSIHFSSCVAGIEDAGFWNCESLTSIIIPTGTKRFFEEMLPDLKDKLLEQDEDENLSTEVTEEDLANAWTDEFGVKYSPDKKRLLLASKKIEKYTIIEGTIIICNSAFERCWLLSVTIPNSIKIIGRKAFQGCFDLNSIELPDNLLLIDDYAFNMCHSVQSLILPSSVKYIGCGAFGDMRGLSSLRVDENNKYFDSRNDCDAIIRTKDNVLIRGCSNTVIPSTVSCIGDSAFSGCDTLCSIIIPNNINIIGKYAFENCELLSSIEIPDGIVTIEDYAFDSCYSLKTISLPNSISKIGSMSFNECGVLSQIFVQNGTKLKFEELLHNYKDKIVEQDEDEILSTEVTDGDFENAWVDEFGAEYSEDRKRLLRVPLTIEKYSIKSGTKVICDYAFCEMDSEGIIKGGDIMHISIPDSVLKIGKSSFAMCNSLKQVKIPSFVNEICDNAFCGCEGLIDVTISDCVSRIENWAFAYCNQLKSFVIPKSVVHLGSNPFRGCDQLEIINCKSDKFVIEGGSLLSIDKKNLISCLSKEAYYNIPKGVTSIENGAFSLCGRLTNISIPDTVRKIGDFAFSGCISLQSISIPFSVTHIGIQAFFNCETLTQIKIPNSIVHIGDGAFGACDSLKQIIVSKGNKDRVGEMLPQWCWYKIIEE